MFSCMASLPAFTHITTEVSCDCNNGFALRISYSNNVTQCQDGNNTAYNKPKTKRYWSLFFKSEATVTQQM